LENVPLQQYTFIVGRGNCTVRVPQRKLVIRNGVPDDVKIILRSQLPMVYINNPKFNSYHSNFDVHLIGEGYDFEDGDLPESSLTWYSSIDGELGKGRELIVDYISFGQQIITLVGVDSDQNRTERTSVINFYYFEDDSYFPIPWQGYWKYKYKIPNFTMITSEGETEKWTLKDLEVSIDNVNIRKCIMNYFIETENGIKSCQYRVIDYFQADFDNIYVEKTTEELNIWENTDMLGNAEEQMNIETVYFPQYVIIKNHTNPMAENNFNVTVSADATWHYKNALYGSQNFTETLTFETSVETGEPEIVETEIGAFEAIPFTYVIGNSLKKWWLGKGIGIIQLEYTMAGYQHTAILYDTNIFTFSEDNQLEKALSHSFHSEGLTLIEKFEAQSNTPERMLEICRLLRYLSPR